MTPVEKGMDIIVYCKCWSADFKSDPNWHSQVVPKDVGIEGDIVVTEWRCVHTSVVA
jgi:hypothetical protein